MKERTYKTILQFFFFLFFLSLFLIFGIHGYNLTTANEQHEHDVYKMKLPPKSLDQYYKKEPSDYLMAMFSILGPMGGMGTHLKDGNMVKAREYFSVFKTEYVKLSKMVPEWSNHFPSEPLDNLEKALEGGASAKIAIAMDGVEKTCANCHQEHRPEVWYKYHWKDYDKITIVDPASGKSLSLEDYMHGLNSAFAATNTYLSEEKAEGKYDKTKAALNNFQQMVKGLNEGCKECHGKDDKRKYFTSSDVLNLLSKASEELSRTQPNIEYVSKTLQGAGIESCYKCHLVHIPAANVHHAWSNSFLP